jgi:hypothetical protein
MDIELTHGRACSAGFDLDADCTCALAERKRIAALEQEKTRLREALEAVLELLDGQGFCSEDDCGCADSRVLSKARAALTQTGEQHS